MRSSGCLGVTGQCSSPPEEDRASLAPSRLDLEEMFRLKFGDPATTGPWPRLNFQTGYFTPDEYYEALIARLVTEESTWMDVGSGRDILPSNPTLARGLSNRCKLLVGVDPDDTLEENPYVHEKHKSTIEGFHSRQNFSLVTLRMVAEHVADPVSAVASLARLTAPGGKVVVYTVNRWAPSPCSPGWSPSGSITP